MDYIAYFFKIFFLCNELIVGKTIPLQNYSDGAKQKISL